VTTEPAISQDWFEQRFRSALTGGRDQARSNAHHMATATAGAKTASQTPFELKPGRFV
jgi:hypothetical protein